MFGHQSTQDVLCLRLRSTGEVKSSLGLKVCDCSIHIFPKDRFKNSQLLSTACSLHWLSVTEFDCCSVVSGRAECLSLSWFDNCVRSCKIIIIGQGCGGFSEGHCLRWSTRLLLCAKCSRFPILSQKRVLDSREAKQLTLVDRVSLFTGCVHACLSEWPLEDGLQFLPGEQRLLLQQIVRSQEYF